jgi:hypothetical protein
VGRTGYERCKAKKARRGHTGELLMANKRILADCRYLWSVFVQRKCIIIEFPATVTSPLLRWRKGSNDALETAATFEILSKPKKPKIKAILYKICNGK